MTSTVFVAYFGWLILVVPFMFYLILFLNKDGLPINWPILGMTPELLLNIGRLHDKVADVLEKSNATFIYRATWLAPNTGFLATSDPANVRHIMNTNPSTYIKGSEWKAQFDIFGKGLFTTDLEEWKFARTLNRGFLHSHQFHKSITLKVIPKLIEKSLLPVLEHVSKQGLLLNLQDLFKRQSYDLSAIIATGYNPNSLSIEFPKIPFSTAMDDVMEVAAFRYILPKSLMMLLKWLRIGPEKRWLDAWEVFDETLAKYISTNRQQPNGEDCHEYENFNFVKYLTTHDLTRDKATDKLERDYAAGLMLPLEDTNSTVLTWFFWILSKNPIVEKKLKEELRRNLCVKETEELVWLPTNVATMNKLVYLHAALCETLRLFPPIPFGFRKPTQSDILPSGHHVNEKTRILLCIHAMGRMKSIWGEDCREFKPERWITEEGKIKVVPPTKFFAFQSGPRTCLGKDFAYTFMKATIAAILLNYDVEVVAGQNVTPKLSTVFHMKNKLMATIKIRQA